MNAQSITPENLTHRLIAAQAGRNPDGVALATGGAQVTYGELERRASKLANHLLSLGAGPEIPVGLCLERSPEFVIAAYAILKCGAAYLPMDPSHPAERLEFIVRDAGVPVVVTRGELAGRFATSSAKIVVLDAAADKAAIDAWPAQAPGAAVEFGQLAYIIYTSGSTGQPKGVEVTHGNLANLIAWHIK
ncbi:MAG TPA: AMP-binding protein, partial [Chthoniobacteraceae bacterium]|nr:AMP-binding protein [Chthoniobacteraceae bacterium]